jgi:3-oxoacyl-[acyl-carrier protein] reductase
MLLKDKVALITGSSRGIGRGIAKLFARNGSKIIVHYNNNKNEADETARIVENEGSSAFVVQADLKDKNQIANMVKVASATYGGIDILVNNAGIRLDGLMLNMKESDWKDVMSTNLDSLFYCCKNVGKIMVVRKRGVIVNISSLSGVSGRAAQTNYAASKAGMIGLTKSLALELARWNIRVNAVIPGMIETDMTKDLDPQIIQSLNIPLGRLGTPDDIAQSALFLASEMSSYITGATIAVNGGVYS